VAAPLPGAESAGEGPPAREPSPEPEVAPPPIPLDRVATPIPLARWLVPIPLAAAVTPIRLSTPIPVSPPFAAVSVAAPLAAPAIGPAADPAPRAERPTEADLFLDEETRFTGDVLRRVREARGLTVQQLCERTKITRRHIENLEADRYEKLPAVVYLRGFLVVISKELRLDGQKVARSYLDAIAASSTPPLTTSRR
jgi:Helix-turn-helix domain